MPKEKGPKETNTEEEENTPRETNEVEETDELVETEDTVDTENNEEEVETVTNDDKEESIVSTKDGEVKVDSDTSTKELEELRTKLAEAQGYKEKFETASKKYEQTQEELKGYEDSLDKIAQERIEAIPEEYRELVPEGTTNEKLDWLAKAEKSGLFKVKEEKSIGSSSRTNDKASYKEETKDMTANQKLVVGITEFLKGT